MFNLDLTSVEASGTYSPIPVGRYHVMIEQAELKETRTGGELIKCTLKVVGGEFDGRKLFTNFNIKNANPKAVEIGLSQLKGLIIASGDSSLEKLSSVTQLEGINATALVGIKTSAEYGDQNVINGYKKLEAGESVGDIPF